MLVSNSTHLLVYTKNNPEERGRGLQGANFSVVLLGCYSFRPWTEHGRGLNNNLIISLMATFVTEYAFDRNIKVFSREYATMSATKFLSSSTMGMPNGIKTFNKAIATRKVTCRGSRLLVEAKVELNGGPRIIRGKCYVTRDVRFINPHDCPSISKIFSHYTITPP